MKTTTQILLFFFLALTLNVTAQKGEERVGSDKINSMKIAYLTEQLELTPEVAKKFWPVYNLYNKKFDDLRKKQREEFKSNIKSKGGVKNITEASAEQIVKFNLDSDYQYYKNKREYILALQKILPNKKILKLQMAERDFRRQLFERLKKSRNKK